MICHSQLKTLADMAERTQAIATLYDSLTAERKADGAITVSINGLCVSEALGPFSQDRVLSLVKAELAHALTVRCDLLAARGIDAETLRRG
ncbi:MAG: hypothetical protein ACKO0Z_06875 [Betaproteobacteria bacterium]